MYSVLRLMRGSNAQTVEIFLGSSGMRIEFFSTATSDPIIWEPKGFPQKFIDAVKQALDEHEQGLGSSFSMKLRKLDGHFTIRQAPSERMIKLSLIDYSTKEQEGLRQFEIDLRLVEVEKICEIFESYWLEE